MKTKKIFERLNAGKTVLVTTDVIQYLKQKGIEYEIVCTNFSHNSSMFGGKRLVDHNGNHIKSKNIKTEIKLK